MNRWKVYGILISLCFAAHVFVTQGPIPFLDDGHCSFEVVSENAAKAMAAVSRLGGLEEDFTFDPGVSHQTVMSDGKTVWNWLDEGERKAGGTANARSFAVEDPEWAAGQAAMLLTSAGFSAEIRRPDLGLGPNKLVIVNTDALVHGCVVFRRHVMHLGPPPGQRRITK